jgi:serine/threonine protein kinase
MLPERWRQIEDLYHLACDRGDGVLANADPDIRREVEALLAQNSAGILDKAVVSSLRDFRESQIGSGSQLGPYKIEALLGQGGMGQVYRALDTKLNRPVAIKVLSDELADADARRGSSVRRKPHRR